nr:type II secretion system F family protein [uncultured Rhodopila sp.]
MSLGMLNSLMLAFAGLIGMGVASLLVDNEQRRRLCMRDRLAKATTPHLRMRTLAFRSLLLSAGPGPRRTFRQQAAGIINLVLGAPPPNPHARWVILGIALILGRLAAEALTDVAGDIGWLAWPVITIVVSRGTFEWLRTRRDSKLLLQFPDALSMIVRSVRAGLPLSDALRLVASACPAPTAGQFQLVAADLSIGMAIADALTRLAERTGLAEYRFFAIALTLQTQTGGRLGETLDSLADVIRQRLAVRSRALALASEARTSALILAALPVLTGGGLIVFNWTYMSVLFEDPTGHIVLGSAFGSLSAGILLMQLVIRRSVS